MNSIEEIIESEMLKIHRSSNFNKEVYFTLARFLHLLNKAKEGEIYVFKQKKYF